MAEKTKSYFEELSSIDLRGREQDKNGLRVVPWAVAYSEIMKYDPDATYEFLRDKRDVTEVVTVQCEDGKEATKSITYTQELPFFDLGIGYEVRTRMTVKGVTKEMSLPVYNAQNNCAMFGVAINLWTKEDAPETILELEKLRLEAFNLFAQKANLSNNTKLKVNEIAKATLPEDCNGDPRICEDIDTLKELIKKFKAVRMIPDEAKATKSTKTNK